MVIMIIFIYISTYNLDSQIETSINYFKKVGLTIEASPVGVLSRAAITFLSFLVAYGVFDVFLISIPSDEWPGVEYGIKL